MYRFKKQIWLTAALLLTLTACGGGSGGSGGSGDTNNAPSTQTGVFLDSAVWGLNYRTETLFGVTNEQGQFLYIKGETVTFSIGSIDFPSTIAKSTVTPLDLVNTTDLEDTTVTNILRLLQSLDEDGDTSNGITINVNAHNNAVGMSIDFTADSFDNDVVNLVANSGSTNRVLVDATTARAHLEDTINSIAHVSAWNNLHGTWSRCDNTPGSSVSIKISYLYTINDGYNNDEYPYRERQALGKGYANTICEGEPVTNYDVELDNDVFDIELGSSTEFQLRYYSKPYSKKTVLIENGGVSALIGTGSYLDPMMRYTRE
jgi:hypothetical protein